jgi:hypothetical protein
LPEGLTKIGVYAFAHCDFDKISLPGTLTEIREGAFRWNTGLTTVFLPQGLQKIGKDAFRYVHRLWKVLCCFLFLSLKVKLTNSFHCPHM